jgi:hypothetical protein
MDQRIIAQQILQYKPTGHRHIGRPRRRWEDDLETEQAVIAYVEVDDGDLKEQHVGRAKISTQLSV